MAKKSEDGRNVAKEIRDYMAQHPEEGPKAVAENLKKIGINTTAQYVSTIKNLNKKKGAPRSPTKRPTSSLDISYSDLQHAKKLADLLGGVERAKRALDAYSELLGQG